MKKIRLAALVTAFIVFIIGYRLLAQKEIGQAEKSGGGQSIEVVVAVQDIGPYTTLTQDMVKVKQIPAGQYSQGYYKKPEEVIGMVCVSNIFQGEVLTDRRLVTKESASLGLAERLEEGKRAVSVTVDAEQGVSNNLRVGNRVDIIFTGTMEKVAGSEEELSAGLAMERVLGPQSPENTQVLNEYIGKEFSVLAMQDVKVAALGSSFFFDNGAQQSNQEYVSVTLEVTPVQAAQIALMKSGTGKIQLVLRPQDDNSRTKEPRGSVLQNYEQ